MYKLVAFDIDGVLTRDKSTWQHIHRTLGTIEQAERNKEKYNSGEINYEKWAELDLRLWKNTEYSRIRNLILGVPLTSGVEETIRALKNKGYKLAILSNGFKIMADKLKNELGFDYAYANEVKANNGKITGEFKINITLNGKGTKLREIAELEGVSTKECVAVGDYTNDIGMFQEAGLAIAFNPHPDLRKYADVIIESNNLSDILEYL